MGRQSRPLAVSADALDEKGGRGHGVALGQRNGRNGRVVKAKGAAAALAEKMGVGVVVMVMVVAVA